MTGFQRSLLTIIIEKVIDLSVHSLIISIIIEHCISCLIVVHIYLCTFQQIRSKICRDRLRTTSNAAVHQCQHFFGICLQQFFRLGGTKEWGCWSQIAGIHLLISGQSACIVLLCKKYISFQLRINGQRIDSHRLTEIFQSRIIRPVFISRFRFWKLITVYQLGDIIIHIILFSRHLQGLIKVGYSLVKIRLVILTFCYVIVGTTDISIGTAGELANEIVQQFLIFISRHLRGSHKQIHQCLILRFGQSFPDTDILQSNVSQRQSTNLLRHCKSCPCRITSRYRIRTGGLLWNTEHLAFRIHHRTTHHLVFHLHTQGIVMVFSSNLRYILHFTRNAGNALLRRIRKHPCVSACSRSSSRHYQWRHFLLGDGHTKLDHIVHIICSQNQADRHLLAFGCDNHRTLSPFEETVVRESQSVFGYEKSVSGIQHLVILIISYYWENSTFRLLHPFRGLRQTALYQEEKR